MINTGNTDGEAKLYIKGKKAMEDALAETSTWAPQQGGARRTSLVEADTCRRLKSCHGR